MLADADVIIRGIAETQVNRLGDALAEGIRQGLSPEELAAKVDEIIHDAQRAAMIAETEFMRAYTAARRSLFRRNGVAKVAWVHMPGACARCMENAAVSPIPLGNSWPQGSVPVHPLCLTATTRVVVPRYETNGLPFSPSSASVGLSGEVGLFPAATMTKSVRDFGRANVRAASERYYVGDVITIHTALGHELTATPNHPIATPRGWVPIAELAEGDYVLSSTAPEWMTDGVDPDVDNVPPMIQEIAQSFAVAFTPMPTSAEDFHGDGAGSEVHIVFTDGLLEDDPSAPCPQELSEFSFGGAHVPPLGFHTESMSFATLERMWFSTDSGMGAESQEFPVRGASPSHALEHRVAPATRLDAMVQKETSDRGAADSEGFCQRLLALASEITTDQVVSVLRVPFSDHVFNLDTVDGWYIGNGIVTHNCRCVEIPARRK
jgi:hypothetical protein